MLPGACLYNFIIHYFIVFSSFLTRSYFVKVKLFVYANCVAQIFQRSQFLHNLWTLCNLWLEPISNSAHSLRDDNDQLKIHARKPSLFCSRIAELEMLRLESSVSKFSASSTEWMKSDWRRRQTLNGLIMQLHCSSVLTPRRDCKWGKERGCNLKSSACNFLFLNALVWPCSRVRVCSPSQA